MAIAPLSIDLPAALRGTGFVPFYTPASVVQSPVNAFTRILETSAATGAPLPSAQALARALPAADTQTLLDRSYFRDLIAGLGQTPFPGAAVQGPSAVTQSFGIEALLGRNGLPQALQQIPAAQAVNLYASALNLFNTIQALGGAEGGEGSGPELGSLLDITA